MWILQRRPRIVGAAALVLVALLSLPAFSLRLGTSDQGTLPESSTARRAYDMPADGFGPGFNGPLQLVVRGRGREVPQAELERLVNDVRATRGVAQVAAMPPPSRSGGGQPPMTIVQVVPTTSPQDAGTDALIDRLRAGPAKRAGSLEVLVGGGTAINKDLASALTSRLPLFVGTIAILGSALLLLAFRSLAVALLAALMNVAAAGAAFGITVALFQWGWGTGVLGIGKPVPITSFLPVIMIAMLFGLSMDYQVFLVGRMREEWLRTRDARYAVHAGLACNGRGDRLGGGHHDLGVRGVRAERRHGGHAGRRRAGGRGGRGRLRPAHGARPGRDDHARPGHLAAAAPYQTAAAGGVRTTAE
ncbi:MMPL family transporter [Spirillospora sp. NPDC048911]|uniref:MMPL family transporter n=1 Tax=Spirillospora sp. NPDC048911 TaxID=3364527 RepID=UPI0037132ED5